MKVTELIHEVLISFKDLSKEVQITLIVTGGISLFLCSIIWSIFWYNLLTPHLSMEEQCLHYESEAARQIGLHNIKDFPVTIPACEYLRKQQQEKK